MASYCSICGEEYEARHSCDSKRLKQLEDGRKAHEEMGIVRTPTFQQRLADGFAMLDDDYDGSCTN